jgi:hypothetical protein
MEEDPDVVVTPPVYIALGLLYETGQDLPPNP